MGIAAAASKGSAKAAATLRNVAANDAKKKGAAKKKTAGASASASLSAKPADKTKPTNDRDAKRAIGDTKKTYAPRGDRTKPSGPQPKRGLVDTSLLPEDYKYKETDVFKQKEPLQSSQRSDRPLSHQEVAREQVRDVLKRKGVENPSDELVERVAKKVGRADAEKDRTFSGATRVENKDGKTEFVYDTKVSKKYEDAVAKEATKAVVEEAKSIPADDPERKVKILKAASTAASLNGQSTLAKTFSTIAGIVSKGGTPSDDAFAKYKASLDGLQVLSGGIGKLLDSGAGEVLGNAFKVLELPFNVRNIISNSFKLGGYAPPWGGKAPTAAERRAAGISLASDALALAGNSVAAYNTVGKLLGWRALSLPAAPILSVALAEIAIMHDVVNLSLKARNGLANRSLRERLGTDKLGELKRQIDNRQVPTDPSMDWLAKEDLHALTLPFPEDGPRGGDPNYKFGQWTRERIKNGTSGLSPAERRAVEAAFGNKYETRKGDIAKMPREQRALAAKALKKLIKQYIEKEWKQVKENW